jgi:hypothetical protein
MRSNTLSVIALGVLIVLFGCGHCKTSERMRIASPNGRYVAIIEERDCSGATGIPVDSLLLAAGNPKGTDALQAVFSVDGHAVESLVWRSPKALLVRHYKTVRESGVPVSFNEKPKAWRDVKIEYEVVPN